MRKICKDNKASLERVDLISNQLKSVAIIAKDYKSFGRKSCQRHDRSSSADGRAGCVFGPALPSAKLEWSSSADGRAGRMFDLARPSAELDWFSLADGRAGRVVDPARPSAELDGLLCPPFNKTSITYVTGCLLISDRWN
ncbi:hypothetical protein F2Q68_00031199 [Brassica cretica]|uniref:Uncharacterized protein n=1 Tax=Brassica cretica TaxID=69181 RepID=A0A8S9G944_BRACR|nr:hypothetical protein F2Q68_00031199 [Brassica cretica]